MAPAVAPVLSTLNLVSPTRDQQSAQFCATFRRSKTFLRIRQRPRQSAPAFALLWLRVVLLPSANDLYIIPPIALLVLDTADKQSEDTD